jgi:energy-coupling factor transport system substrate-specific component
MRNALNKFTIFELVIIALMAALGLATKPIIVPLTHMVTGPLFIPGGAVAGGFYMFWIVLSAAFVKKRGVATLTALTQAIIVIVSGSFGSHGIVSLLTYTLPGFMVDFVFVLLRRNISSNIDFFVAGVIANISGTYLSNLVFFRLPFVPLVLSLATGALSGGLGGLIAYLIYNRLERFGLKDLLNN